MSDKPEITKHRAVTGRNSGEDEKNLLDNAALFYAITFASFVWPRNFFSYGIVYRKDGCGGSVAGAGSVVAEARGCTTGGMHESPGSERAGCSAKFPS